MCLAIFQLLIQNAGAANHTEALKKANAEYEKYKEKTKTNYRSVKDIL